MSSTEPSSGGGRYDDVLTTHNYDGIQEYDNPMPSWWTWIFIASCVWAAVYFVGINIDMIPDTHDQLAMEMAAAAEKQAAVAAVTPPVTTEMLANAAASDEAIAKGETVFKMQCAACHGQQGQGLIGPNLTDDAWVYGGSLSDIHAMVDNGKPDKGMPAWGDILVQDDQLAVVAYVDSIRGTNPPDAKAPEGEVWTPEGEGEKGAEPAAEPGDDKEGDSAEKAGDGDAAEEAVGDPVDGDDASDSEEG